jgi:hypothetical protein
MYDGWVRAVGSILVVRRGCRSVDGGLRVNNRLFGVGYGVLGLSPINRSPSGGGVITQSLLQGNLRFGDRNASPEIIVFEADQQFPRKDPIHHFHRHFGNAPDNRTTNLDLPRNRFDLAGRDDLPAPILRRRCARSFLRAADRGQHGQYCQKTKHLGSYGDLGVPSSRDHGCQKWTVNKSEQVAGSCLRRQCMPLTRTGSLEKRQYIWIEVL